MVSGEKKKDSWKTQAWMGNNIKINVKEIG
jgi:hypothetical protein